MARGRCTQRSPRAARTDPRRDRGRRDHKGCAQRPRSAGGDRVTGVDVPLGRAPLPRRRTGVINRSSPPITNELRRCGGGYDRVFVLVAERWRIAISEAQTRSDLRCRYSWRAHRPGSRWRARMLKTAPLQWKAFRARSSRSPFQPFFANVRGGGEICGRAFVDDLSVSHDVQPMGDPQNDSQLLLDEQNGDAAPGDLLE